MREKTSLAHLGECLVHVDPPPHDRLVVPCEPELGPLRDFHQLLKGQARADLVAVLPGLNVLLELGSPGRMKWDHEDQKFLALPAKF